MATATQTWLRASLEQLLTQRTRYALARKTATAPRARARHARTVARLDTEIAGHRRALATSDPAISLTSRPCLDLQVDACELSGQYDKVGVTSRGLDWAALRARVPSVVWLAMLVALVVGFAGTGLAILLEPTMARAAEVAPSPNVTDPR